MWQILCLHDMLHVTHDMWHIVGGEHPLQIPAPQLSLTVWDRQCLEDPEQKDQSMKDWINLLTTKVIIEHSVNYFQNAELEVRKMLRGHLTCSLLCGGLMAYIISDPIGSLDIPGILCVHDSRFDSFSRFSTLYPCVS